MIVEAARKPRTRAVFFDWYGTLVSLAPLDVACEALAPGRGAALATRWRARQLEASWLRTIMGSWADFDTITMEALRVALAEIGETARAGAEERLVRAFLELPPREDAASVLEELRRQGLAVGILSNGSRKTLEYGAAAGHFTVDHLLSADDVHRFKPHPSLYKLTVVATALPPAAIGFVTGNGWDAAGAASFGLNVLWLKANASAHLPAVGSPQPIVGSWDDVLASFAGPAT